MVLYLDTSALVKCYGKESGSVETNAAVEEAQLVGTVLVSRAEWKDLVPFPAENAG